jgi:hypothetical protein
VLMVPALAQQDPRLIVLGAVPIVGYADVLAGRVLRPGGTLDQAYAAHDTMLAPLGLRASHRPDVVFAPRLAGEGMQSKLIGPDHADRRAARPLRDGDDRRLEDGDPRDRAQ